ncbi:MAG TPA: hypothetical protein PKC72_02290 [Chitinophagaceae bacterium]|nr:hypothetical protein [Chitinophagaceae bacterium]
MIETKIRLSQKEMELVNDADVILTKNTILQKAQLILGHIAEHQQKLISNRKNRLADGLVHTSPKISRGENYKGLPWLMLDYPRKFEKENFFAIRTMFWWGNFFSITLHISGQYQKLFSSKVILSHQRLKEEEFYVCRNNEQWEHHFENENYLQISMIDKKQFEEIIQRSDFFKLSFKIPIERWDEAIDILLEKFRFLIEILEN